VPLAPVELHAQRHGGTVDVEFSAPTANRDGTRPANISRIDVYALTSNRAVSDGDVIKFGTRISSIAVKAPRDPNETIEPDEAEDLELVGSGLDQGARAHVVDRLTPATDTPIDVTRLIKRPKARPNAQRTRDGEPEGPLLMPDIPVTRRVYVGVSVTKKGQKGPSSRGVVAMIPTPQTMERPTITYDEKSVTVAWPASGGLDADASAGVLPSRTIGISAPTTTYNVYQVSEETPPVLTRLTANAVAVPRFADSRIEWGQRRCYVVRAVVTVDDASLEGDESPPSCVTLTDTFPPAAPVGLQAVPSEATINLIWDANTEPDLRGYIVLRGPVSADTLEPLTPEPIQETSYQDKVQTGIRFAYAVRAVDTAGNLSVPSARVEETAR
jgi:hypothetical protein